MSPNAAPVPERICTELTHGCCPIPDATVRPIFKATIHRAHGRGLWLLPSAQDGRAITGQEPAELQRFGIRAVDGMFWVSEAAVNRMIIAVNNNHPAPFAAAYLSAMRQRLQDLQA